ncbi:peroxiredoxin [Pseudaminobacter salicylatoxidans]|uniref:Peroxiredoxin n=1 Tax=Pseudaminobacter salicylatoxidans TaxID=93369 RepID=A0A316C198_PSESE|nr:redoxin domain-containing protein [Pseudaminobacter salicylatoxidans]PWJ82340.1 peroxiredoxin [Pseudaminobacter salicylatoxidans]
MIGQPAPELDVAQWFNTPEPLTIAGLRGKIVVLHAFQMLCPGCVRSGLPQAQRIAALFSPKEVAVIGIHTVFEHHEAMTPVSLAAFIHEYRLGFPIAVDRPGGDGPIPRTMAAYQMRGTPSLVLIDRDGMIRRHSFGAEEDLQVGAEIAFLLTQARHPEE